MRLQGRHKTLAQTLGVVLLMGGLAWASVPFYDWFCRVTGFGGTTSVADMGSDDVLDRTVKVRFDASIERGMPWEFRPVERTMEIRIGETGLAFYEAHNPTSRPVAGSASYGVFPYEAGGFFTKIDCFCFEEQVLQPGETVLMPVSFYVDPEMVEDRDAKYVTSITLSYTFHEIELPDDAQAALTPAPGLDTTINATEDEGTL
ncbi:Cytochrome oxidase biogenesis protein Cox11-CtaG, copper delivery to Cox1 [Candidatus Rhodobacter oscarellae]|uniref:Cytochrome c oxidase assembly protein CtaG n=1 Tax=Candidatus Rhodobacter oscarellae TaxID=1675527 RepID=A0A0J9EA78_9RHOB|nr:cytochrome c oxidase assembly protein [Candidatus Rhodobacter lobularis]KMW59541.1 Cytochrome oxidase biogenesis protein Cox11-CtaG, copper delivery to Cox1 [Candidatus Rhodobacter lobularis]